MTFQNKIPAVAEPNPFFINITTYCTVYRNMIDYIIGTVALVVVLVV